MKHYNLFISHKGESLRLVYYYKQTPLRETRRKWLETFPETWHKNVLTACSYSTAATVITWSSIDDINSKMGKSYNHLRYRCNIVIKAATDTPYQEDNWRKLK